MNNISKNMLGYIGTVTLSRYIGKKKIKIMELHNSGGTSLFSFLTDCLLGLFDTAQFKRPYKIMLLKEVSTAGSTHFTGASKFILPKTIPEKVEVTTNLGVVRYSYMLEKTMLTSDFDHIGLYAIDAVDTDPNNFAAIVQVPEEGIQGSSGSSQSSVLVLDWELQFINAAGDTINNSENSSTTTPPTTGNTPDDSENSDNSELEASESEEPSTDETD